MVTNGSMEGAALLFRYLVAEGDRVVIEQPTYDRTLLLLQQAGAELIGAPLESDGVDPAAVEAACGDGEVALAHVIPNFHNPAGCTLSIEKRRALVQLAADHGFILFEDDPYRLISLRRGARRDDAGHGRRGPRDPRLLVLEVGQPGGAGRLPGGPGGADRDARQAGERDLHLAEHARRVDRLRALPLGRTGREPEGRQRSAPRASGRARRGTPRAHPRGGVRRARAAATSSGSTSRTTSTARRCSPRRSRRASPSSPARTSCWRAAPRACASRSRRSRPRTSTRAFSAWHGPSSGSAPIRAARRPPPRSGRPGSPGRACRD